MMGAMLAMSMAVAALAGGGAEGVELRGGEAAPAGIVLAVDGQGVHIGPEGGTGETLVIPWDRVRSVQDWEGPAAQYRAMAEDVWRARTRLERGDFIGAEALFERLFAAGREKAGAGGFTGATAAVVAEGLLRCRLRRGAHIAAIEPWLAMLGAGGTGGGKTPVLHAAWAAEAGLPAVIDPATGLAPALPPMWLGWQAVVVYGAGMPEGTGAGVADRAAAMAQIYAQAARFEAGLPALLPELATNDPGVNLAWQIVRARTGTPEQRAAARKSLKDRLHPSAGAGGAAAGGWQEAWVRAAVGRSLVLELGDGSGASEQGRLGIIELLTVPAKFPRAHPYLAGLTLAEASVSLRGMGDPTGADVLARELFAGYPNHPVLDWEPVRSFRPTVEPVSATPAAPKEGALTPLPEPPPP